MQWVALLPASISLGTSIYVIVSIFAFPWLRTFISAGYDPYFSVRMPLDIGILKCFSEICRQYADATKGGDASDGGDSGGGGGIPFHDEAEDKIEAWEAPFKHASIVALVFMMFTILSCGVSVGTIIFNGVQGKELLANYRQQTIVFFLNALSLLCVSLLYMAMTYGYLNGGFFYFGGVYMMNILCGLNAVTAAGLTCLEARVSPEHRYMVIQDTSNHAVPFVHIELGSGAPEMYKRYDS